VPDRIFWKDNAKEIILPTLSGQMGVLTNHIPLLTGLELIRGGQASGSKDEWNSYAIMGGFALVKQNQVTILANEAVSAEKINPEEAKNAFEVAKSNLEKAEGVKEKVEANFSYKRAKARFQVVKALKKI